MKALIYTPDGDGKAKVEEIPAVLADPAKTAHEALVRSHQTVPKTVRKPCSRGTRVNAAGSMAGQPSPEEIVSGRPTPAARASEWRKELGTRAARSARI